MVAAVRGGGLIHVKRTAKKPPLGFLAGEATTGWTCGGTAAAVESMQGVGSVAGAAASSNSVAAFHIWPDDPCLRNDTADRCSLDILLLVLVRLRFSLRVGWRDHYGDFCVTLGEPRGLLLLQP